MPAAIVCSDLSFDWPDGTTALSGLDVTLNAGRTGLIGVNGSGKSTLLRLIAGELRPSAGLVRVTGEVGYLPQTLTLGTSRTVCDLLGISAARAALHAVEAGSTDPDVYAAVGDDWDIEERARAWLDRLGLDRLGLDDPVGRLSGGETVLAALAALFLRRPDVLLLDEPTNNLDLDARSRLYAAVADWTGVLVVVSHDRELLAHVDQIADLSAGGIRLYGGNLADYEVQVAGEREAAERAVTSAAAEVRRERRDLLESQVKQARRDRQGRKAAASGMPKIVANARKRHAQETAGRGRELHTERLEAARDRLAEAERSVRDDAEIHVVLPATAVPPGRTVLTVAWPAPGAADLILRGPERVALTGPNGGGKTTLLRAIAAHPPAAQPSAPAAAQSSAPAAGLNGASVRLGAVVGYLPQRLDVLDGALSVVDKVRAAAPAASVNEVRASLARFLFRGERADRPAGQLSGGERFRAVLAALLLAQPAPQLLLLDEPTNNLDLASVRQLTEALSAYRGALIVASHDVPFLRTIGITRWLRQDREAPLTEIDPL